MTHRDRAGDPRGMWDAAGVAVLLQGVPTPSGGSPARPERRLPKAFGRPKLSDGGPSFRTAAHAFRCPASPAASLLPGGSPARSLWVMINAPWYKAVKRLSPQ